MKKKSVLCKVFMSVLACAVFFGISFTTIGRFVGTNISVNAAVEVYGDFEYVVNNDNTINITRYKGNDSSVTIPNTIDGKNVKRIFSGAFKDCTNLTSVTIPDSVIEITYGAFYNCQSLTSITIPNSVEEIGDSAFYNCRSLTSITIPNRITHIYENVFSYSGLKNIIIPDNVTAIGEKAFFACPNLISITIPNSVNYINDSAFAGCTNLTNIAIDNVSMGKNVFNNTAWYNSQPDGVVYIGKILYNYKGDMPENTEIIIPDGITEIGYGAFENCTGLTSVTIPNSVTRIRNDAFLGCTGLTSIMLPDSITKIEMNTFENCTGLTDIVIFNSVTEIGIDVFHGTSLKDIYFVGTESEWKNINISELGKSYLRRAKIHYVDKPPVQSAIDNTEQFDDENDRQQISTEQQTNETTAQNNTNRNTNNANTVSDKTQNANGAVPVIIISAVAVCGVAGAIIFIKKRKRKFDKS